MDIISYYKKKNIMKNRYMKTFFKTPQNTRQFYIENKITTLALPKLICCGLDKKRLG
jgi:hypothetical protein